MGYYSGESSIKYQAFFFFFALGTKTKGDGRYQKEASIWQRQMCLLSMLAVVLRQKSVSKD